MAITEKPISKDELKDLRATALKETPVKPITPAATATAPGVQEEKKVETPASIPEVKVEIKAEEKQTPSLEDLSEDEFLKVAEKRGLKISKETLTAEQQKKQSDIEEAEKYKFAIENNLITPEGYMEAKQILQSEGSDLTRKEFIKAYQADNKSASKEEIEAAYNDYYFVQQTITEKKVKRDEKGNVILNATEDDVEEEEISKNKWDERFVSLGEKRRIKEGETIKANAKAILDNVDSNYQNFKTIKSRADEYSKVAGKVMTEIDFNALPVVYKFGEKGKEKEIKAIVKLNDEAKADVQNYINTSLAHLIIHTDKYKDSEEIGNQIKKYIKDKYDNQVGESLWNLGKTEGLNEGKVGASAPIVRELVSDDSRVDTIVAEVEKRLPENKLFTRGRNNSINK